MIKLKKARNYKSVVNNRILAAALIMVVVGFSVLLARLAKIQIIDAEEYERQANNQQIKTTEISATRGSITDRNGNVLAMSSTAWTICISPNEIANETQRELMVSGLSEILNVDADYIREKSYRKSFYEVIKSRANKTIAEEVTNFASNNGIGCIFLEESVSRTYPYESFASSVIGFVNAENTGAYGIESYYNTYLAGTNGKIVSAKNAWGSDMPFEFDELYSAIDGYNVKTTIDNGIQYYVEKHLELAVKEHGVKERAACIAMNPKTGEIYAMATKGDFNPNQYLVIDEEKQAEIDLLPEGEKSNALSQARFTQWRNKAISDPYEPGSVFKIITLSSAIDSGAIGIGETYYCPGYIEIADRKIACWKTYGHGEQTLAQAIQNSCNPAFITIGERMGKTNFFNYFEAFGLTERTNIDLPGEATSIYHSEKSLTEISLASSSFGQTFKVTPIQLITAVSAAINGGNLYTPYVVSEVTDSEGNVIESTSATLRRHVISESTSEIVRQLLATVTTEGSGKTARVPGYTIGGKTGTSEKLDKLSEEGTVDKYVSSFLAFAPVDDPEIVILLLLDEADMENPFGSVIAAPVVGAMMADILPYMGIEPNYTQSELDEMKGKVKDVTENFVHDALYTLRMLGYSVNVVGDGTKVVAQLPEAGTKMEPGATVTIYTDEEMIPTEVTVPDVSNMTVAEVNTAVVSAGLKLKLVGVVGTGEGQTVYSQSPVAGTKAYLGSTVEVSFKN